MLRVVTLPAVLCFRQIFGFFWATLTKLLCRTFNRFCGNSCAPCEPHGKNFMRTLSSALLSNAFRIRSSNFFPFSTHFRTLCSLWVCSKGTGKAFLISSIRVIRNVPNNFRHSLLLPRIVTGRTATYRQKITNFFKVQHRRFVRRFSGLFYLAQQNRFLHPKLASSFDELDQV